MGSELELSKTGESSWTGGWFSWTGQSNAMLRSIEKKILASVKTVYKRFYVDIGSVVGQCDKIWTISLNDESPRPPLLLLHGMAAGVALWCPNLDAFAATRPVYAIDLLGFGRSSRPRFASDAEKVEAQWVESIEQWRREVNLPQFILLGHSLGGYIATAYAIKYPERVKHLILADPWGFPEKPDNVYEKYQMPIWARAIATVVQPLNPLWILRAAGPAGKWLISKARSDLSRKYKPYVEDADNVIPEYIHQCNSQSPSGESAFHRLMTGFGWAKNPMGNRISEIHPDLPITVLYGSRSWVDNSTARVLSEHRPGTAKTYVQVINGAGHHIYLDKPELFNKYVLEACARADDAPSTSTPSDSTTSSPANATSAPVTNPTSTSTNNATSTPASAATAAPTSAEAKTENVPS